MKIEIRGDSRLAELASRRFKQCSRSAAVVLVALLSSTLGSSDVKAETRTLRIHHVNLNEDSEVTFKRDGKYLAEGLKKANWAFRDWRRNQPTKMDPRLLDLLWEAYRQSGSRSRINVLGGFRAPETNKMLRSRSANSGVAERSQHMVGNAVDFFIPDVPLAKLRQIGMRMQIGGVGYYPRSGSPFVHFDVGSGRYWPRMSRQELARIFPDGNTIHVPSDGRPLPGYATAMASYKVRKGASELMVADAGSTQVKPSRSLFSTIFRATEDADGVQVAANIPADTSRAALVSERPVPGRVAGDAMASAKAIESQLATETVVATLMPPRVPVPASAPRRLGIVPPVVEPTSVNADLLSMEADASTLGAPNFVVPTPHERPSSHELILTAAMSASSSSVEGGATNRVGMVASAMQGLSLEQASTATVSGQKTPGPPFLVASLKNGLAGDPVGRKSKAGNGAAKGKTRGERVLGLKTLMFEGPDDTRSHREVHFCRSHAALEALMIDPRTRAARRKSELPDAGSLMREPPHEVLALGFVPTTTRSVDVGHFAGKAVNFLPMRRMY